MAQRSLSFSLSLSLFCLFLSCAGPFQKKERERERRDALLPSALSSSARTSRSPAARAAVVEALRRAMRGRAARAAARAMVVAVVVVVTTRIKGKVQPARERRKKMERLLEPPCPSPASSLSFRKGPKKQRRLLTVTVHSGGGSLFSDGFEPPTSGVLDQRHNQLDHENVQ